MIAKVISIPEFITEKTFLEYMRTSHNLNGIKFNKSNFHKIGEIMSEMEDYAFKWSDYQSVTSRILRSFGKGSPDFLVYNKKHFMLCEFKTKNDPLSPTQIFWFDSHSDLPLGIIIAGNPDYVQEKENLDEDDKSIIA